MALSDKRPPLHRSAILGDGFVAWWKEALCIFAAQRPDYGCLEYKSSTVTIEENRHELQCKGII